MHSEQYKLEQWLDNFCQFMDNAGFTPDQITQAMIVIARNSYGIELIKSK